MSHSEKVCRIGSAALAPITALCLLGAFAGVMAGLMWLIAVIPAGPGTVVHSILGPIVMLLCIGALLAVFSVGVYPWLYRHCRGGELMTKFEQLEKERKTIVAEYDEKIKANSKRMDDLMAVERAKPL